MSDGTLTFNSLFNLPDKEVYAAALRVGIGQEELNSARKKFLSVFRQLQWKTIEAEFHSKAAELLNMDVLDLVMSTWKKYAALADALDSTRANSETVYLALVDHSIECELHPYIEIQIGSLIQKIPFDVTAKIELKGLELKIEEGKIKAIEAGVLEGRGQIKVHHSSILDHKFKPVHLPGKIQLGKVFQLPPAPAPVERAPARRVRIL